MKIKIASNFHVFVPKDGRDRRVAFTAGAVLDAGELPEGQSAEDWIAKDLAVAVDTVGVSDEAEAEAAV